ncbi:PROTEIN putative-RELATED [Salix viminalis]|uniref:PROTEIN putative-RELATED n=1 Tax=Salix viminalis TaxID=40686 RepID=A0A9Q0Z8C9_SALVM|nr:PROTEIN putative-RELATED [Salix viminalis]
MNPQMTSSSSAFSMICILHSMIAITSGSFMMFQMKEIYTFTHGIESSNLSLQKGALFFMFSWLFGGSILRGESRCWLSIA